MKVLLCSPYNAGPDYEQGGIVVWANNIMSYYHTLATDVIVDVVPFNRKVRQGSGMFSRVWGGIMDYRSAIKEMAKQLNYGYDVLHLCTSGQLSLSKDCIVLRKAKRKGVKTVVHLHFGRMPEIVRKRNWEWKLLKTVMKLADAVVTMDLKSYNALQDIGFSHIHYLPNPLSHEIIQQISDEDSSVERVERKLCFVGHVIPTKGVYEMVRACKQIDNIKLHVIGKVAPEVCSKMEEIAGKGDWLVFVGEVSHNDVIREMLSSSIFLLPSYTEGFPNVILEAMACSCAIVATDVGAIPEMLEEGKDGFGGLLIKPKDVEGLKKAICKMIENEDFRKECQINAKRRVVDRYSMSQIWNRMVAIWSEINQ